MYHRFEQSIVSSDGTIKMVETELTGDLGTENKVINIYPDVEYQTIEGFGGAITDAAGYVYSLLNDDQKKEVISTYFSPDKMGYDRVRINIDSCDFSTGQYAAMNDPRDSELNTFSFARTEKYIIPMLMDAQRAAGKPLKLMLSPWSPPAFMKTNGERTHGGSLKPEYYDLYAHYLCRYIEEFRMRGFFVERISIQNEPKAVQTWDSCIFTAQEEKLFLRDHMIPAMKCSGLGDVEVFIWDHNKERVYERVREIIDDTTEDMVAGCACHWYSGDHFDALDMVHQQYPNLRMVLSESCIEYRFYGSGDVGANAIKLAHELIGDLSHGMSAIYDWNLLLDERGGPNTVGNWCWAPFLYNRKEKKLNFELIGQYFYQFSHFIKPGAKRIATSRYNSEIDCVAVKNPNGEIVVILANGTSKVMPVHFRLDNQEIEIELPDKTLNVCVIV